jgi:hypothetical protein
MVVGEEKPFSIEHFPFLIFHSIEWAGRAKRRRRFGFPGGVALRLSPLQK